MEKRGHSKHCRVSPQILQISSYFLPCMSIVMYFGDITPWVDCLKAFGCGRSTMLNMLSSGGGVRILWFSPKICGEERPNAGFFKISF